MGGSSPMILKHSNLYGKVAVCRFQIKVSKGAKGPNQSQKVKESCI